MKKIIKIDRRDDLCISDKWTDCPDFKNKNNIVDGRGKIAGDSGGRRYKLIAKQTRSFSNAQRFRRGLIGCMALAATCGIAFLSNRVRDLLFKKHKKIYYALATYPLKMHVEILCHHSSPCKHSVTFIHENGEKHFIRSLSSKTIYAIIKHYPELFGSGKLPNHFDYSASRDEPTAYHARVMLDSVNNAFKTKQNRSSRNDNLTDDQDYYTGISCQKQLSNQQFTYTGQVLDGVPEGKGTMIFHINQLHYEGEFRNGQMHGKGITKTASGNIFEGDFENDKMLRGIYKTSDGITSEEEYKDDKLHGKRTETSPDGKKRISHWVEGKLDGTVEIFDETGKLISKQEYKNGVLLSEEAL